MEKMREGLVSSGLTESREDRRLTWHKVSDSVEDGHDDVFRDTDDIGSRDLGDGDFTLIGGVQVLSLNVV
jgi:hypothetical protein